MSLPRLNDSEPVLALADGRFFCKLVDPDATLRKVVRGRVAWSGPRGLPLLQSLLWW